MDEGYSPDLGINRRQLIKRGAIIGGTLVWVTPAVQSIGRAALAGTNGTPVDDECCHADGFGLRVIIPTLGIDQTVAPADGEVLDTGTIGEDGTATVHATIVQATASSPPGGPCDAVAKIASLDVVVGDPLLPTLKIRAETLQANAVAACEPDCGTTGSSTIQKLEVNGTDLTKDVQAGCNVNVLALLGLEALGDVTFNRQQCSGDTLGVDGLFVDLTDVTVIASHAEAGAAGCPCNTCS